MGLRLIAKPEVDPPRGAKQVVVAVIAVGRSESVEWTNRLHPATRRSGGRGLKDYYRDSAFAGSAYDVLDRLAEQPR